MDHGGRHPQALCNLNRGISPHNGLVSVLQGLVHRHLQLGFIVLRIAAQPQIRIQVAHLLRPIHHIESAHHGNPLNIPLLHTLIDRLHYVVSRGFKLRAWNVPALQGMGRKSPGYDHVRLHLFQCVIVIILNYLIPDGFRLRPFPEHLLNDRQNVRIWCKKYNFNHTHPPPIVHIIPHIVFSQSLNCI